MRYFYWVFLVLSGSFACGRSSTPVESPSTPVESPSTVETDTPVSSEIEITVLTEPRRLLRGSKVSLYTEIVITNRSDQSVELNTVRASHNGESLSTWTSEALEGDVLILRADTDRVSGIRRVPVDSGVTIDVGTDAAFYASFEFDDNADVPSNLSFLLSFTLAGREIELTETIDVAPSPPPMISPPIAGGGWFVINAPQNASPHRRALFRFDDELYLAQRFAMDILRVSGQGSTHAGEPRRNESYYSWGTDILAVSDGVVAAIHDGVPENEPGRCPNPMDPSVPCDRSTEVPMTAETLAGNTVVLEIAPNTYAVYAHLVPGSIRVSEGERVTSGQVIAALGNSGNSTEPHLHFHLCDRPSVLACQGIPFGFDSFIEQPVDPRSGPVGEPEMRRDSMPNNATLVHFPPFPEGGR